MRTRLVQGCILGIAAYCCACAPASSQTQSPEPAPQQPPATTGSSAQPPDPLALRREYKAKLRAVQAALTERLPALAPHVVRIQIWNEMVSKRVDGVEYDRRRLNGPSGNGIIVRDDPLVLVSGSIGEQEMPKVPNPVAPSPYSTISPDHFEILTRDNTVVPAEIVARDETLNVMLLRPLAPEAAPASMRINLSLDHVRRPEAESLIGIAMFADSIRDGTVTATIQRIPPGKDGFRRPAVTGIGRFYLGLPLFAPEGDLIAVVGIAPPSTKAPPWATDASRHDERPADRDPGEFENGRRHAVLLTFDELKPLLERWLTAGFGEHPFDLFGFALQDGADGPRALGIRADGAAAAAGLQSGDVVIDLGGDAVATIEAFTTQLEQRLGAGASTLQLKVKRGASTLDLELSVP